MESLVSELLELMPDTVIYEPMTGQSSSGVKSYGTAQNIRARVSGRVRMVMGDDGKEHVSTVMATLAGAYGVTTKGRFTLPLRFSTNPTDAADLPARRPQAISVLKSTDENGPHHEVVYF